MPVTGCLVRQRMATGGRAWEASRQLGW